MILPSERRGTQPTDQGSAVGMPVRLLGGGGREVSRLEFLALGQAPVAAEVATDETAGLLREEMASLDRQLRSLEEQRSAELEKARSEARAEARLEWQQELEANIAEERKAVLKICTEFVRDRARYFAGVEAEVVKLALAIAARVLQREAKLDPLLLSGVVRVALEKLTEGSSTVLRVPAAAAGQWREIFEVRPESPLQVVGDERLAAGECVLETNVGKVELGVSVQLEEIEHGFFDLMEQRPA